MTARNFALIGIIFLAAGVLGFMPALVSPAARRRAGVSASPLSTATCSDFSRSTWSTTSSTSPSARGVSRRRGR